MCDMRVMSTSARVSEGYVKVGLTPGDGIQKVMPRAPLNLKAATAVGISMQPSRWRQVSNCFHAAPA